MSTLSHMVCGVIPPHILRHVAEQTGHASHIEARATLDHMSELGSTRTYTLIEPAGTARQRETPGKRRTVYDAEHAQHLPGRPVMDETRPRISDLHANEAFDGSGATYDFFYRVFGRRSIDGRGMPLDATVHYGTGFENALWNGHQMVYGDGDGRVFERFTASIDVIGHELTHGVTQHAAALGYSGQTGALNEHISDAFGIMVKQYALGQNADESDWLIGAEILGPDVQGHAVRSMAFPGTAYDDPLLGTDPQPSHMRDYVDTLDDNGGVHINSGILNHAFYIAAMTIGGPTWEVLGRIWYVALTDRLEPDADFDDFTQATHDIAGELFGVGSRIQRSVDSAWADVGLSVPLPGHVERRGHHRARRQRVAPRRTRRGLAAADAPLPTKGELKS